VTTLPSARKIPACKLPLVTAEGKREYATYARILFEAGRLDAERHVLLSLYASAMDEIARRVNNGESVRAAHITRAQSVLRALKIDDLTAPIASPEQKGPNRFAIFGFAARSRRQVQADLAGP
jgi:hypothetical protein